MTGPSKRLVNDLARLAAKHRAKEWEELAEWIEDPRRRQIFRDLLLDLAAASEAGRKAKPRKKRQPSGPGKVREQLRKMRSEDPDRADLLEDVWLKLRQRELLPTLPNIRAFAEAMGSKSLKADRRDQAVTELMEMLINLAPDSFEQKLRQAVVSEGRDPGNEYQDWVRLILQRW